MDKLQVTREQAEAIKKFKTYEISLETFVKHRGNLNEDFNHLNCLSVDEVARALYRGFEVKSNFVIGDWIYDKELGVKRVVAMMNNGVEIETDDINEVSRKENEIRHATQEEIKQEKERRWWSRHGREPYEFRPCDILEYDGGLYVVLGEKGDNLRLSIHLGGNTSYYQSKKLVKQYYSIVCLAENRVDEYICK